VSQLDKEFQFPHWLVDGFVETLPTHKICKEVGNIGGRVAKHRRNVSPEIGKKHLVGFQTRRTQN
jgi:hypothetical protein